MPQVEFHRGITYHQPPRGEIVIGHAGTGRPDPLRAAIRDAIRLELLAWKAGARPPEPVPLTLAARRGSGLLYWRPDGTGGERLTQEARELAAAAGVSFRAAIEALTTREEV